MPFPDDASPMPGPRAGAPRSMRACGRGTIPGLRAAALLLGTAGSLAACTQPDAFAPACPQLSLLQDGADLSRFAGTGRDLTDQVMSAHMTTVPAACENIDRAGTKVQATLKVNMAINRGPAMQGRSIDVPYFVAVTDNGRVLDRQAYAVHADFPANADRITASGDQITLVFPVTRQKSAAAYQIWVSFQLTPQELAYNRAHPAQ